MERGVFEVCGEKGETGVCGVEGEDGSGGIGGRPWVDCSINAKDLIVAGACIVLIFCCGSFADLS